MGAFERLQAEDPQQVGPYRIVARLGEGGMGQVYLGRSKSGRAVAVKVVRPDLAGNREFRSRFAREVAVARTVNGFFTAGVVAADPHDSPPWLATAYVPGMSLEEAVTGHGPWPEASVLALGAGLAEALESIHAAGVVHRDLKPSNVLLAADGPRVIDFGISVAAEESRLTQTGVAVGTLGFMSPEQLTGAPVGPASDVFCLGAVLAFTATGTGPFGAGSWEMLLYRTVYREPDLARLTPTLRSVVARCLAKQPEQRPSAPALLDELAENITGASTIVEFFTESAWLPDQVAQVVRTHVATPLPATPPPLTPPPLTPPAPHRTRPLTQAPAALPSGGNPQAPRTAQHTTGKLGGHDLPRPFADGGGTGRQAAADVPADRRAGVSRRTALFGLAGLGAAAGIGAAAAGVIGSKLRQDPVSPGERQWIFSTGDRVRSSPAVAGGVVYVGSEDHQVYAVDAATGEKRWSFTTGHEVRSSPAVAGGVVYVGSMDEKVYAVDAATGGERWSFTTSGMVSSSPAVADGIVYVGNEANKLYALDAATGGKRWFFTTGDSVRSSPAVAGGVVYVGSWDDKVYALDAATGGRRWSFATGFLVLSSPAVADGTVYIGSQDHKVYAIDAATGRKRWSFTTGDSVHSSPVVVGGVVYVGSYDHQVYALDAATGRKRWSFTTGDSVHSSPVVVGGVVYVGSYDHQVYALDAATGQERWSFTTGDSVHSSPAVAGGVVYVGSNDKKLYAIMA